MMDAKKGLTKMMMKKKKKPMGYMVQGPDQQYGTGQMGKQPIPVFPLMGKAQKRGM